MVIIAMNYYLRCFIKESCSAFTTGLFTIQSPKDTNEIKKASGSRFFLSQNERRCPPWMAPERISTYGLVNTASGPNASLWCELIRLIMLNREAQLMSLHVQLSGRLRDFFFFISMLLFFLPKGFS